jgi:hypothetical protein
VRTVTTLLLAGAVALAPACATTDAQVAEGQAVQPPGPPPGSLPPPPPNLASRPEGQWVFTQQYGWIWMPHGDAFTWVPPGATGEPLEFVFHGSYGWTWVAAPWVWGAGPSPWFGRPGPRPYAWFQRGTHRPPQRGRFVPLANADRRGVRPPPPRPPQRAPAGSPRQGATGHVPAFEPSGRGGE